MHSKYTAIAALIFVCPLFADNVVHPGTPVLDRPTLTALGVQLPITGDDNFNATVSVEYRVTGTTAWRQALPLFRVHPENTAEYTLTPQFAGSIFDLKPGTSYDIELQVQDADGPVNQTLTLSGTTRPVPGDPPSPRVVNVSNSAELSSAMQAAQPGDIIQVAPGFYSGTFFFFASGTAQKPIVIRGAGDSTVFDGGNCASCNVIEIYGNYVHLESMLLQNAQRAIRFQTAGSIGNVVRYVHTKNTILGIGSQANQLDFYIADNILEGRLTWPHVWSDDNGAHATDDGIHVEGFGHVIAHNRISGFGDAMKTEQDLARAVDFYGNEVLFTYDNGVELDGSAGNTRCFRNRFSNTFASISVQPIYGGPAYIFRNVVVNTVNEQMKFHSGGASYSDPNGVLAYHNTFLSPTDEVNMCTPAASHHFWIENNLFVGPAALPGRALIWCGPIDDGHFDYDGYWPDGSFSFNVGAVDWVNNYYTWNDFAQMKAAGMFESHGELLSGLIFANGMIGPSTYTIQVAPQDLTLAGGSSALDHGLVLPNINDGYTGSAPDLGALERGCPEPTYGPRPAGTDESNEVIGCESSSVPVTVSISINPQAVTLVAGQSQTFTPTVTGSSNTSVSWSVSPANVGTFTNGAYTAPASITSMQTVSITATSNADSSKFATAVVTLKPPTKPAITVTVNPTTATAMPSQQVKVTAFINGMASSAVTWSMTPNAGQLQGGVYTAPATIASTSTVTITATSQVDTTKSASAIVTLQPAAKPPVKVTVNPTTVSLSPSQKVTFTAYINGTASSAVTWSMSPKVGRLTQSGVYTAPASITSASTVTIRATSREDSKTGSATVQLQPPSAAPPPTGRN